MVPERYGCVHQVWFNFRKTEKLSQKLQSVIKFMLVSNRQVFEPLVLKEIREEGSQDVVVKRGRGQGKGHWIRNPETSAPASRPSHNWLWEPDKAPSKNF